ncbi:O-antigen ligase family protein [Enterovibrio nigricans]|uniref:O-antigen ligase n=1 Tax=Enterovibrio nigricans DSM 22720 TaxID=1121868 RepID=A0A1T4US49_9GAMM|nr:O-antigen ligase family protein [Enterovibrio nigricans]PKF51001.1 polymerase [Enterovibrio nigricans]SKA55468.1 O-antigen ligase [Enterovibrio nigricans DSM 22720]
MASLEKLSFYSLLLLIIWLPIPLGSNRDWAWAIAEIWIALQSVTLILVYRGNLPSEPIKRYSCLLFGLALFQVWVFFQTLPLPWEILAFFSHKSADIYQLVGAPQGFVSLDSRMTLTALFKGIAYTLFVLNAIFLVSSSKRLKHVVLAIVISGTLQAFYAAMVVLLDITESPVFDFAEEGIATGSFIYKNHLANYLMMALCMGLGLIVTQLHTSPSDSRFVFIKRLLEGILSRKMYIRLCLVIMVIALVMTRSRMGNTAFFAATAIGGLLALLFYKNKPRALTVLVASVIAIDTIVVGALFGLEKVKQRLVETSLGVESRDQVVIWSLDIIRDFPLTGTGMASFYTIFPMYSRADIGFYDHAHNDYIQFMVEAGIPATLLLGFVVLYAFARAFSTIRKRHSKTMKGIALGCIMSIIGMLIHISVDFNLQPMANALTFILILFLANASAVLPASGTLVAASSSQALRQNIESANHV